MARAVLIVLDSVGVGGAEDAFDYGDSGANTLLHIAEHCARGRADRAGLRAGPLRLPNLAALGLGLAAKASARKMPPGLEPAATPSGKWGYGVETSRGKDTPSGHWEIAGTPVKSQWGYFTQTYPSFPKPLLDALIAQGAVPGILGDCHASGTDILDRLGEEHMRSGKPICYTSVDSVFQIAAHEETFGLQRLYDFCVVARRLCDPLNIGRVIARPFTGASRGHFTRTPHRKDYAVPPPPGNILERAAEAGRAIVTIGKVGDIFAHRHTGEELKGASDDAHVDMLLETLQTLPDGGLAFVNLVDFDSEFGHRRDVAGYADCLERFDARLPEIRVALRKGDLCVITADHGNDPTWRGTDHTREHVPVLAFGPGISGGGIGRRETLADIAATLCGHLGISAPASGKAW